VNLGYSTRPRHGRTVSVGEAMRYRHVVVWSLASRARGRLWRDFEAAGEVELVMFVEGGEVRLTCISLATSYDRI